ncbi:MAG: hypothetical protein HONBIEJF_02016 [Fimbriimonadaceae bacterium]|nr:hypothetical protein [Fimbriimonadaceae bacterium]
MRMLTGTQTTLAPFKPIRFLIAFALVGAASLGSAIQDGHRGRARLQDLPQPLQRMFRAQMALKYTGVRLVEFKRDGKRIQTEEIISKDGPRYRIEYPRGSAFAGQIIVENGRERLHFFPDTNEIKVLPRRKDETLMRIGRMLGGRDRRGSVDVKVGERVANRATQKVSLSDSKGNVLMRLWIDEANGMLLKREMLDLVGSPIASFEFRRVDYNPVFRPADFEIQRAGARRLTLVDELNSLTDKLGFPAKRLTDVPDLQLDSVRPVWKGSGIEQLYVGSGKRISFFMLKSPIDPERLSKRSGGKTASAAWQSGGVSYVLIGNVDQAEIDRLANRLK